MSHPNGSRPSPQHPRSPTQTQAESDDDPFGTVQHAAGTQQGTTSATGIPSVNPPSVHLHGTPHNAPSHGEPHAPEGHSGSRSNVQPAADSQTMSSSQRGSAMMSAEQTTDDYGRQIYASPLGFHRASAHPPSTPPRQQHTFSSAAPTSGSNSNMDYSPRSVRTSQSLDYVDPGSPANRSSTSGSVRSRETGISLATVSSNVNMSEGSGSRNMHSLVTGVNSMSLPRTPRSGGSSGSRATGYSAMSVDSPTGPAAVHFNQPQLGGSAAPMPAYAAHQGNVAGPSGNMHPPGLANNSMNIQGSAPWLRGAHLGQLQPFTHVHAGHNHAGPSTQQTYTTRGGMQASSSVGKNEGMLTPYPGNTYYPMCEYCNKPVATADRRWHATQCSGQRCPVCRQHVPPPNAEAHKKVCPGPRRK